MVKNNIQKYYTKEHCQYGLVMGICVGTKEQDTTNIRKGTIRTDEGVVCEGCFRVHFSEEDEN